MKRVGVLSGRVALVAMLSSPLAALAQTPPATPAPAAAPAPATPAPAPAVAQRPLPGGPDFISPVGEPFHSEDKLSGAEHWYAGADTDHDGRLTYPEYLADAERFFKRLDVNHDGEIDPNEIEHYETVIAPEVRVLSTGFDLPQDENGNNQNSYPDRLGAGRYSYVDLPEPITAMDTNFNRGVSHKEFVEAARKRFVALDVDTNGVLTREELPRIERVRQDFGREGRGKNRRERMVKQAGSPQ